MSNFITMCIEYDDPLGHGIFKLSTSVCEIQFVMRPKEDND